MWRIRTRSLCLTAAALVACSSQPSSPTVGESQQPIVGGTVDTADTSVVLVIAREGEKATLCTGAVVSPHVVLTAGHCVDPAVVGAGATYSLFLGDSLDDASQRSDPTLRVAVAETHFDPMFDPQNERAGHDVGVIVTSAPVGRSPLPMHRMALTSLNVGTPARLVGYGVTSGTDTEGATVGTRRQATNTISALDDSFIYFPFSGSAGALDCQGDSGGPALIDFGSGEEIAGVAAFGDQSCQQFGAYTRVDAVASFVDGYIQQFDPDAGTSGGASSSGGGGCDVADARTSPSWGPLGMSVLALLLAARRRRSTRRRAHAADAPPSADCGPSRKRSSARSCRRASRMPSSNVASTRSWRA